MKQHKALSFLAITMSCAFLGCAGGNPNIAPGFLGAQPLDGSEVVAATASPGSANAAAFTSRSEPPAAAVVERLPDPLGAKNAVASCPKRCLGRASPDLVPALQERGAQARRCYNQALAEDPTLQGVMQLHLRVAENGRVCQANITASEMPDDVNDCVRNILAGTDYPASSDGCVGVTVPIRFSPGVVRPYPRSEYDRFDFAGASNPAAAAGDSGRGQEIRDVVVAHRATLRACYDASDARDRGAVALTVQWAIDPAGAVSKADIVASSGSDDPLGECVLDEVRSWHFPAGSKHAVVAFPFAFGARAELSR